MQDRDGTHRFEVGPVMPVEAVADLRRNVGEQERFRHGLLGLFRVGSRDHVTAVYSGG